MAKAVTSASDDDDVPVPRTNAGNTKSSAHADEVESEEDDEGDGEEEYEIESILDSRKGVFEENPVCVEYIVLKVQVLSSGYSDSTLWRTSSSGKVTDQNITAGSAKKMRSTVHSRNFDQNDTNYTSCRNAQSLISEFNRKQKKSKGAAKSISAPVRKNASVSNGDGRSASVTGTKKRGRKSDSAKMESDVEMSDGESALHTKKKARTASTKTTTDKRSKAEPKVEVAEEDEEEVDENGEKVGNMQRWIGMDRWDHLVQSIDTVERRDDGALMVFFTL